MKTKHPWMVGLVPINKQQKYKSSEFDNVSKQQYQNPGGQCSKMQTQYAINDLFFPGLPVNDKIMRTTFNHTHVGM